MRIIPRQIATNQGDIRCRSKNALLPSGVGSLVCLAVLGTQAVGQHTEKADAGSITKAVAVLFPTKGSDVKGRVTFTHDGKAIHVHAEISGLTPGEHGFHIHEFGVWSEDGLAAGSHFNPTMEPHAGPKTQSGMLETSGISQPTRMVMQPMTWKTHPKLPRRSFDYWPRASRS